MNKIIFLRNARTDAGASADACSNANKDRIQPPPPTGANAAGPWPREDDPCFFDILELDLFDDTNPGAQASIINLNKVYFTQNIFIVPILCFDRPHAPLTHAPTTLCSSEVWTN